LPFRHRLPGYGGLPRRTTGDHLWVLGVNAALHHPATALVVDGEIAVAAEEGAVQPAQARQSDRCPFATRELP